MLQNNMTLHFMPALWLDDGGLELSESIRITASFCGGVGLKPSRVRVSFGPMLDEIGYGLGQ